MHKNTKMNSPCDVSYTPDFRVEVRKSHKTHQILEKIVTLQLDKQQHHDVSEIHNPDHQSH